MAPQDMKAFPGVAWIEFDTLHELVVEGGGIIDGQGTATWAMSGKRKPIVSPHVDLINYTFFG